MEGPASIPDAARQESFMSRRTAKVSEAIREIVSTTILFDLKDPRVKNVTVLWVDSAPDLRSARVFISVRGEPKEQALTLHGLNSARGYVQSQIADKLDLRYTPILQFVLDPGARQAAEISSLLRSAMEQTNRSSAGEEAVGSDVAADADDGVEEAEELAGEEAGELSDGFVSEGVASAGTVTSRGSTAAVDGPGALGIGEVPSESGGRDANPLEAPPRGAPQ